MLATGENIFAAASAVMLLAIAAYVTANVVGRLVDYPVPYTVEVNGYMMVALVFLVGARTLRMGQHVKVELVTRHLSVRAQGLLLVVTNVLTFIVILACTISFWEVVISSYVHDFHSSTTLRAPLYLPQLLGAMGLSLFAVESAAVTARSILHRGS